MPSRAHTGSAPRTLLRGQRHCNGRGDASRKLVATVRSLFEAAAGGGGAAGESKCQWTSPCLTTRVPGAESSSTIAGSFVQTALPSHIGGLPDIDAAETLSLL